MAAILESGIMTEKLKEQDIETVKVRDPDSTEPCLEIKKTWPTLPPEKDDLPWLLYNLCNDAKWQQDHANSFRKLMQTKEKRIAEELKKTTIELVEAQRSYNEFICAFGVKPKIQFIKGAPGTPELKYYDEELNVKSLDTDIKELIKSKEGPSSPVPNKYEPCAGFPPTRTVIGEGKVHIPEQAIEDHPKTQLENARKQLKAKYINIRRCRRAMDEDIETCIQYPLLYLIKHMYEFYKLTKQPARKNIRLGVTKLIKLIIRAPEKMESRYLNMVIMGPPGTGKSVLSRLIGKMLIGTGILGGTDVLPYSAGTFIGQFAGSTVAKSRLALIETIDRVAFIDEAYALTSTGSNYGQEAINEIVEFTQNHQGQQCLIAAGYENDMRTYFLGANEGMNSRFPYQWVLQPFSGDHLFKILQSLIKADNLDWTQVLSSEAQTYIKNVITNIDKKFWDGQARDMVNFRNALVEDYITSDEEPIGKTTAQKWFIQHLERLKLSGGDTSKIKQWLQGDATSKAPRVTITRKQAGNRLLDQLEPEEIKALAERVGKEIKGSKAEMIRQLLSHSAIGVSAGILGSYLASRKLKVTNPQLLQMLMEMMSQRTF
uniref:AAA+ ATPase domain-containing protein n=1 Tax=viral metagenome TaxID=1070528 RepID=A0A6C0BNT9_9ZZZZ